MYNNNKKKESQSYKVSLIIFLEKKEPATTNPFQPAAAERGKEGEINNSFWEIKTSKDCTIL